MMDCSGNKGDMFLLGEGCHCITVRPPKEASEPFKMIECLCFTHTRVEKDAAGSTGAPPAQEMVR
jgi:cytochrome c oxidase assembly protein Cox11